MNLFEGIAISTNLYWGVTLLLMIRAVRLESHKNQEFVSSAVEGNVWFGAGEISISWFTELYKKYVNIKGINFIVISSLASLATCVAMACYFVFKIHTT